MCIFCKIVAGEIPCRKIYEDNSVLAFLDINPVAPGHVLIVSKEHVAGIEDASEPCLLSIMSAIKKVGARLMENLPCPAYNVHQNNGSDAGQEVLHLHFHVIPRHSSDGLENWHGHPYREGEAEVIQARIMF